MAAADPQDGSDRRDRRHRAAPDDRSVPRAFVSIAGQPPPRARGMAPARARWRSDCCRRRGAHPRIRRARARSAGASRHTRPIPYSAADAIVARTVGDKAVARAESAAPRVDHIGIAVSDVAAALAFYRDALGLAVDEAEEVPSQRVRAHFIPAGETALELLEATSDDSPIAKYLAKRGPGIHHITLAVPDIRAALVRLKERGIRLIDEEPRPGAHGSLVAFVHPGSAHGVLVELKERPGHEARGSGSGSDSRR